MKRLLVIGLFVLLAATVTVAVTPGPPRLINYQGRLTDASGTPLPDGAKSVRFIIWNDPTLSAPANEVWNSGPVTVTTTSGLFSLLLGASPQPVLTPGILADTLRWLGITVGADPEISPRTRLVSVPYAFSCENAQYAVSVGDSFVKLVGDTMTGDLVLDNDAAGYDAWLWNTPSGAEIRLGHDGVVGTIVFGDGGYGTVSVYNTAHYPVGILDGNRGYGGALYLRQEDGTTGATFNGGTTSSGATLTMYNAAGSATIALDAEATGDAAVDVPNSSISSTEILNEPGVTYADNATSYDLTTSMSDLVSVTISTPADRDILVHRKTCGKTTGTRSINYGYVQIDQTTGGTTVSPYFMGFGQDSSLTTGLYFHPVYVHRVYYKSAGVHTFNLEAMAYSSNGAGAVTACYNSQLVATYYPTGYGVISALVGPDERSQFEQAVLQTSTGLGPENPAGPQTSYRVDLRELEIKAAKAEAETERVRRELAEARLQQNTQIREDK